VSGIKRHRSLKPSTEIPIMPNPFVHAELATTNVRKAKAFYSKLFAWKLKDMPMPTPGGAYTMIDVGEGTGGGIMQQMMPDTGSAWMPYVLVKDIDASTRKAKKLGAKICKGVTKVGSMGWLSILTDPTGATFGLWETNEKQ
jgi:uncharacterized protein